MQRSTPVSARRGAVQPARRRWALGWTLGEWAMFLGAYLVIAGAIVFAAPQGQRASQAVAPAEIAGR